MSAGEKSLLVAITSAHGKAVVTSFYRLLEEVGTRDEAGAALATKFQIRGELLCRAAGEVEMHIEQVHTVRRRGRAQREDDIAVRRWAGSLLSALIPWAVDGGATRVKGAVAAAKNARERNEAIAEIAGELLTLLERHRSVLPSDLERGVPHVSPDVALPLLRRDLHRLIHLVTGTRRQWRKAREVEIRANNGVPPPKAKTSLAHGAQGLISEIDRVLPFPLSSGALIDLWDFVSGDVIGESAVRAARARAVRTSSG